MPHVLIEKTDNTIEISVDDVPVVSAGLDLHMGVMLQLVELVELLEEASDEMVDYVEL